VEGEIGRGVLEKRARCGFESWVEPEVEIRAEEPVREGVRDGDGEFVGALVDEMREEGHDVDVIGGEGEGADGGDQAPEPNDALDEVNKWAKEETQGKNGDALAPFGPEGEARVEVGMLAFLA